MTTTPPIAEDDDAENAGPRPPIRWPEVIAGVALNLVPIIGVLFWHWSAFALIFLYWLENVVVGVRTLASMLAAGLSQGGIKIVGALGMGAFFTFHYGIFCLAHGAFVIFMFGGVVEAAQGNNAFGLVGVVRSLFADQANLVVGFAAIALWQFVIFVLFVLRGEARRASLSEIMGAPYGRIVILHVTIIFGGFVLMMLGWPIAGVVMLAVFKTIADVAPALGFRGRIKDMVPKKA